MSIASTKHATVVVDNLGDGYRVELQRFDETGASHDPFGHGYDFRSTGDPFDSSYILCFVTPHGTAKWRVDANGAMGVSLEKQSQVRECLERLFDVKAKQ